MSIFYTRKAKDDLARINWQEREKIISFIGELTNLTKASRHLASIRDSGIWKTAYQNHVILAVKEENSLNIVKVIEKHPSRFNS